MALKIFILLNFLTACVISDSCVTYNFEEEFDIFSNHGICRNNAPWIVGNYEDLGLASPNEHSTKFITPSLYGELSCASSSYFIMQADAELEFNVYVESGIRNSILFMAFAEDHSVNGLAANSMTISGWQTVKMPIYSSQSFRGYVRKIPTYFLFFSIKWCV